MVAPKKNSAATAATKGKIVARIEEEHGRVLTERQKTFAELYVEGTMTNTECARRAGFSHYIAHVYAAKLLNGNDFPHVVEYIKELREAKERKYGVTTLGQLERLYNLSRGADREHEPRSDSGSAAGTPTEVSFPARCNSKGGRKWVRKRSSGRP